MYDMLALVRFGFSILDRFDHSLPSPTADRSLVDQLVVDCAINGCKTPLRAMVHARVCTTQPHEPPSAGPARRRVPPVGASLEAPLAASPRVSPGSGRLASSCSLAVARALGRRSAVAGSASSAASRAAPAASAVSLREGLSVAQCRHHAHAWLAARPLASAPRGRRRGPGGQGSLAEPGTPTCPFPVGPLAGSAGAYRAVDLAPGRPAERPLLAMRLAVRGARGGTVLPLLRHGAAVAALRGLLRRERGPGGAAGPAPDQAEVAAVRALLARPPVVLEPAAAFSRVCVATPQWALAELQQRRETVAGQAAEAARERAELQAGLAALVRGAAADRAGATAAARPPRPAAGPVWSGGVGGRLFGLSGEGRAAALRAAEEARRREIAAAGERAEQLAARVEAADGWMAPADAAQRHLALQQRLVREAWGRREAGTGRGPEAGAVSRALAGGAATPEAEPPRWWGMARRAGEPEPVAGEAACLACWRGGAEGAAPAAVEALVASGEAVLVCQQAAGEDAFLCRAALLLLARSVVGALLPSGKRAAGPAAAAAAAAPAVLSAAAPEFRLDDADMAAAAALPETAGAGGEGAGAGSSGAAALDSDDAATAVAALRGSVAPGWEPGAGGNAIELHPEDGSLLVPVAEVEQCAASSACRNDVEGSAVWHLAPDAPFSLVDPGAAAVWRCGGGPGVLAAELRQLAVAEPWLAWAVWDLKRREWARGKRREVARRTLRREDSEAAAVEEAERQRMAAVLAEAGWTQAAVEFENAVRLSTGFPALSPSVSPASPVVASGDVPSLALACPEAPGLATAASAPSRQSAWGSHAATRQAVSGKHHFPSLGRAHITAPAGVPPAAAAPARAAEEPSVPAGSQVSGAGSSIDGRRESGRRQQRKGRGKRAGPGGAGQGLLGMQT